MRISEYARHGANFHSQEASKPEASCKWIEFQERTQCACANKADAAWLLVCSLGTHDYMEKSHAALNCWRQNLLSTKENILTGPSKELNYICLLQIFHASQAWSCEES